MEKGAVSNVLFGTGNYNDVKCGNMVSITGDGGNAWGYYGQAYKKLAPRLYTYTSYINGYQELLKLKEDVLRLEEYIKMRKLIEDEYIRSYYETRLKDLNVEELLDIFEREFGNNIILLCHENVDEFCHRRLVADYIEMKTGIYVPEVSVSSDGIVKELTPIRYKSRLKEVMNRF